MSQFNTSHPDRLDIMADVNDLEDTLQDKFYWDFNADSSRLANIRMITNKSVDDEIGRLIKVDSVLFVASIIAIVFILCCTFIKSPNGAVRSRFVAGLSAFVIIMFSIMFAFGMMGMIGVPMNSICIMICFVVAGVGVDDMIVIENFYNKSIEDGLPRGLRMAEVSSCLVAYLLAANTTTTFEILLRSYFWSKRTSRLHPHPILTRRRFAPPLLASLLHSRSRSKQQD